MKMPDRTQQAAQQAQEQNNVGTENDIPGVPHMLENNVPGLRQGLGKNYTSGVHKGIETEVTEQE
jgi:hypothetical protein